MKKVLALIAVLLLAVAPVMAQTTTTIPTTTIPFPLFCEGNFDCDQDVDGTDAATFKSDFGRSSFQNPCSSLNDCPAPWSPCPDGMLVCSWACVDPMTDEANCGGCNVTCSGRCLNGVCQQGITAPLGKTGQTISYATGDDGYLEKGIEWPTPRFTDNEDGTVTDNLTGLIWLKNAGCLNPTTWFNALLDCNVLVNGSCGLTDGSSSGDWRLPNYKELLSLVDVETEAPVLPSEHPFNNVQTFYYWTSTTYFYSTGDAWFVGMDDGNLDYDTKNNNLYHVWPVRGPE